MKFFVIASILVAAAYAEANADPYYAAYGYAGLPVAGAYAGAHLGAYAGAYGAYPYGAAYGAYPYAAYSGYSNVSPSASLSIAGAAPAAVPVAAGLPAAAGRYCANSAGVIHCA